MGFADDTVAMAPSVPELQRAADASFQYGRQWRFNANVNKSAVVVFGTPAQTVTEDTVSWDGAAVPRATEFPLLGCVLQSDGRWDAHVAKLKKEGKKRLHALRSLFADHAFSIPCKLQFYKVYLRHKLEVGCAVWEPETQLGCDELERIQNQAVRLILGCAKATNVHAMLAELGLEPLKSRRELAKLRWQYQVHNMDSARFPSLVYRNTAWPPRQGSRLKTWAQTVAAIWPTLGKDAAAAEELLNSPTPAAFDRAVRDLVAERDAQQLRQRMQASERMAVLECIAVLGEAPGRAPARYLCGRGRLGAQLKFMYRSGTCPHLGVEKYYRRRRRVAAAAERVQTRASSSYTAGRVQRAAALEAMAAIAAQAIAQDSEDDSDAADSEDDADEQGGSDLSGGTGVVRRFATTPNCKCCPTVIEDIPHVLVDCPAYAAPRQALLAALESRVPPAVFSRFLALPDSQQRAAALLSDAVWGSDAACQWVDRRVKAFLLSIEALRVAQ